VITSKSGIPHAVYIPTSSVATMLLHTASASLVTCQCEGSH